MDPAWNASQPIYVQIRARIAAMILDGALREGDALPSVRTVAADTRVNPLTVLKGYQQLVDEGLVEARRGLGMYVKDGAVALLRRTRARAFPARHLAERARDDRPPRARRGRAARASAAQARRAQG